MDGPGHYHTNGVSQRKTNIIWYHFRLESKTTMQVNLFPKQRLMGIENKRVQKNIYFCFIDYAKVLTVWITTHCGKFLKRWVYETTWPASWEICMQVKKQQFELNMKQPTGSNSGKEYGKAVYCHRAYLPYMQSKSWEMLDWMKHELQSRFPGEISITSDMQMTPPLWQKVKRNCRGPAWGTSPMANVMRKEAWHTQRRDQASGNPLFPSIYPKTRVCFMLSPTPLTLWGALPHHCFSRRRSKHAAPRQ